MLFLAIIHHSRITSQYIKRKYGGIVSLNAEIAALLDALPAMPPLDYDAIPAAQLRAMLDAPMATGAPISMARVQGIEIPLETRTLAARLYVPETASILPPLVVYLHGGGWVLGTLATHDATCRALARASGAAFLSLAYRLAPENPYPAPLDDVFDAVMWCQNSAETLEVDVSRMALAGDSAGANLAAATAIRLRDAGISGVDAQLLLYPVTDRNLDNESYQTNGNGDYFLSTSIMRWFWKSYVGTDEAATPSLAALLRHPDLGNLPPATIITAQFDPLRNEGAAYAARLSAAGTPCTLLEAPGMIHGFISMFEQVPSALPWIDKAGAALRAALTRS